MDREKLREDMLELLAQNVSLQELVNEAARLLGNPVVIIDTRFRILYVSEQTEVNVELWKRTMEESYVSDEIISSMEDAQLIGKLKQMREPVKYGLPDGYNALRMPLFYRKRYCGFVGTYDYLKPMEEGDAETLGIISKAVSALLYTDSAFINYDNNVYESFLYQLLQSDSMERAELVCRKNQGLSMGKRKTLVVLSKQGTPEDRHNMPSERIKDMITQSLYQHYSTIYEDRVVLLFRREKMSVGLWNHTLSALETYCSRYELTAGVSYEFQRLEFVPYAYQQAVFATNHGKGAGDSRVFPYEDCMMDQVMEDCLKKYPSFYYEHPMLRKLREYDDTFSTDYLPTLQVYLMNFCNLKATSDQMEIHYNTMKYRMTRIEHLFDHDLKKDNDLKRQLVFSLLLSEYEQKERERKGES